MITLGWVVVIGLPLAVVLWAVFRPQRMPRDPSGDDFSADDEGRE